MSDPKDIRVLIAEDDYLVSKMINGLLVKIGYTVVGKAPDGLKAIEMTQSLKPDVVVMDIKMPEMDGIEATQHIYETCPTPVVVLTAFETRELLEKASAVGIGAYLVKPPKSPELERAITIAMARFGDMMELRRLNTQFRHLNAQLKAHNEDLETFSHTMAQDLQNPLNQITEHVNVLAKEAMLPDDLHPRLESVGQLSRDVSNIISELQLLASVRKAEITTAPLEMAQIMQAVQKRLAPLVAKYQAEITLPDKWPTALGHAPWIEEVWVNYVSNALKYGDRPPRLQLGATTNTEGIISFWVQDNGRGIILEEHVDLFIPFTRLARIRPEGYGLGLSVAHRIIQKLGGQVRVESKTGHGSVFVFTLPAVK